MLLGAPGACIVVSAFRLVPLVRHGTRLLYDTYGMVLLRGVHIPLGGISSKLNGES